MSVFENFNFTIQKWFKETVFPVFVKFNNETKNCPTTVEELDKLFNMQLSQVSPFPSMDFSKPQVKSIAGGGTSAAGAAGNTSGTTTTTTATGSGRGRKKQESANGEKCCYVFTKNARKDETCGKNAFAYGYCRACIIKGDAKAKLLEKGITPEMIEAIRSSKTGETPAGSLAGINTLANGSKPIFVPGTSFVSGSPVVPPMNQPREEPVLVLFDESQRLYQMVNYLKGAVFHQLENGTNICIGLLKGNNIEPLNQDEQNIIKSLSFTYIDTTGGAGSSNGTNGSNGHTNGNVQQPPMTGSVAPPPMMNSGIQPPPMFGGGSNIPPMMGSVIQPPMMGNVLAPPPIISANRVAPQISMSGFPNENI